MLLLAMACSHEDMGAEGGGVTGTVLATFRIGTPESEEVEYTRATQDAAETVINSLTVYDFRVIENSAAGKADTLVESVQHLVDAGDGVEAPKAGEFVRSDVGATVCLSIRAPKEAEKHVFAFVANEERTRFDTIAQQKTATIDELRWTPSTRKLKDGESCGSLIAGKGAVMSGTTVPLDIPTDLENADKMKVMLYRIVARVDVVNEVDDIQYLRIVDVSAENCAPAGYLFEWSSTGEATAATRPEGYTTPIALTRNPAVTTEELEGLRKGQTAAKVLYLYEYPDTEEAVPTLVLSYTLNGVPRTMRESMMSGGKRIDIKRNRIYKLTVGGTAANVRCSVTSEGSNK